MRHMGGKEEGVRSLVNPFGEVHYEYRSGDKILRIRVKYLVGVYGQQCSAKKLKMSCC